MKRRWIGLALVLVVSALPARSDVLRGCGACFTETEPADQCGAFGYYQHHFSGEIGQGLPSEWVDTESGHGYHLGNWCGRCDIEHDECEGGSLALVETVRKITADRDAIAEIVRTNSKVILNSERNVVEVLGCSGEVVATFASPTTP